MSKYVHYHSYFSEMREELWRNTQRFYIFSDDCWIEPLVETIDTAFAKLSYSVNKLNKDTIDKVLVQPLVEGILNGMIKNTRNTNYLARE